MSQPVRGLGVSVVMSIRTSNATTARCKNCNQRITDYFSPGYCSPLCYHKHKGGKLLNTIRHDHKFCICCGEQLKEVEPPTDEQLRKIDGMHSAQAVVGYEYPTPNAVEGEKPVFSQDGKERIVSGLVCGECGNAEHHREFPEWQDRNLFQYAASILDTLQNKQEEHHTEICEDTFFEMLYCTGDIEFSLGKAAHD